MIQGGRDYQEDALKISFDEVAQFHTLSEDAQSLALEITYHEMQKNMAM
jgi:hypothetical protein